MSNKTCGECRFHKNNRCMLPCYAINHPAENSACHCFEVKTPPTNGDKIRQMSNEELAELFDNSCNVCSRSVTECDVECVKGIIAWLNAPADAPDINVGTKESEGEDE